MAWQDPWNQVDKANALRMQSDAQGMNMLQAMGNMQTNALQRQQLETQMADEMAVRDAYKNSAGDPSKLREALTQRGAYKQIQALDEAELKKRQAEATTNKAKADAYKSVYELSKDQFGAVMNNPTPEAAVGALQRMNETLTNFGFKVDMTSDIQAVSQMTPDQIRQWAYGKALKAEKLLPQFKQVGGAMVDTNAVSNPTIGGYQITPTIAEKEAGRHNQVTEGISRGQLGVAQGNLAVSRDRLNYDRTTGKAPAGYRLKADGTLEFIPGGPADPARTGELKLTEDQGKATGWLVQADNAYKNMQKAIDPAQGGKAGNAETGLPDLVAGIPSFGAGEKMANLMRGEGRQKFVQAASSLSEALLRAATGAGVNESEARQKIAELTPQIGDGAAVRKQKMEAIPLYLESLKVRAGPGAAKLPTIIQNAAPRSPQESVGVIGGVDPAVEALVKKYGGGANGNN